MVALDSVIGRLEVDVFILEASPKSFDEDVVNGPAFAVHAQFDLGLLGDKVGEDLSSELAALVSVDNLAHHWINFKVFVNLLLFGFWLSMSLHPLFEHLFAPFGLHGIGQAPTDNVTAV